MEKIYRPRYEHVINVQQKFDEFKRALIPESVVNLPEADDKALANFVGDDEDFEALEDTISLEHLAMPDDLRVTDFNPLDLNQRKKSAMVEIPTKALRLKSVQHRIENQAEVTAESRLRHCKYNKYKYMQLNFDNQSGICDLTPLDEILLVVRVYEPFNYIRGTCKATRKPRLNQEFAVVGSQLLTELRDKIYCQCNFGPFYDISNDFESISDTDLTEDIKPLAGANRNHGPGFFFITDTFYNDTRHSTVDYTAEIREWMQRQPDIGEMTVATMEGTKFSDLKIRLGFPQVYRHQSICEHLFTFSDIRLLANDDSLKRIDYPMLRIVSSTKSRICAVCGVKEAIFIVRNCVDHIHDPTYLCRTCLISYHYVDDEKEFLTKSL